MACSLIVEETKHPNKTELKAQKGERQMKRGMVVAFAFAVALIFSSMSPASADGGFSRRLVITNIASGPAGTVYHLDSLSCVSSETREETLLTIRERGENGEVFGGNSFLISPKRSLFLKDLWKTLNLTISYPWLDITATNPVACRYELRPSNEWSFPGSLIVEGKPVEAVHEFVVAPFWVQMDQPIDNGVTAWTFRGIAITVVNPTTVTQFFQIIAEPTDGRQSVVLFDGWLDAGNRIQLRPGDVIPRFEGSIRIVPSRFSEEEIRTPFDGRHGVTLSLVVEATLFEYENCTEECPAHLLTIYYSIEVKKVLRHTTTSNRE